jgi:hypothetical protein|nr:MAG TPA: Protein of unknown function (DUF3199) [Bacteriophage sp.]
MLYTTLEQVKIRLKQYHMETTENASVVVWDELEDNPHIEQLIEQARQEIVNIRNYPSSYTQEQIDDDLAKYESVIVNLTVYDHSQAGESFMASYSENGISRNWVDRNNLLAGVIPFVKVL